VKRGYIAIPFSPLVKLLGRVRGASGELRPISPGAFGVFSRPGKPSTWISAQTIYSTNTSILSEFSGIKKGYLSMYISSALIRTRQSRMGIKDVDWSKVTISGFSGGCAMTEESYPPPKRLILIRPKSISESPSLGS
jgi:hypothetical protein